MKAAGRRVGSGEKPVGAPRHFKIMRREAEPDELAIFAVAKLPGSTGEIKLRRSREKLCEAV